MPRERSVDVRGLVRSIRDGEAITDRELRNVVLLADLDELTVTWTRYAPGERGPDLHVHREHTDAFYVLEGELTFELGPAGCGEHRAPAGGFVAVPPNVAHSFVNTGSADARFLNLHAPDAGFAASMRARRDGGETGWDSFDAPPDGGLPAEAAVVAGPGEGERVTVGLLKCALPDISVVEWTGDEPLADSTAQVCDDHAVAVYVLAGSLDVALEGSVHAASPGTLAAVPRGVPYTFGHGRTGGARLLEIHAPGRPA